MPLRLVVSILILVAGAQCVLGGQAPPSDALALGIAQYQAGNYAQALALFLRAVELAPGDPQRWFWLGATYLKLNRPADAAAALRRAVELDPRNGPAFLFLGQAYLQLNRRDDARRAFELALQYAPTAEYADAARQWLQAGPAGSPPASQGACPAAPALPAAQPPPPVQDRRARIEITVFDIELEDSEVVVSGELENLSEAPVRDIRIEGTVFGLAGQQIAQRFLRIGDIIEGGDGVNFSMRFSTAPPPLWVRIQVLDYVGRSEPADVTQFPVPLEVYADLARSRVQLGLSLTPSLPAARHLLCVWIADARGFPIAAARVRVTLSAGAGTATQVRSLDVTRDKMTAVMLTSPRPTSVTARTEIEEVELSY